MKKNKPPICLIRLPSLTTLKDVGQDATPPIGLAYLASSLNAAGHEVIGIDGVGDAIFQYTSVSNHKTAILHGLTLDQIINRIPESTEIIGISCMFSSQWTFINKIFKQIREKYPKALIILGGEHATACPEYVLKNTDEIDLCVMGEGEDTINEVIDAYYARKGFTDIDGLAFRNGERFTRTNPRRRIRDINSIPEPNWDIFPIEQYIDNAFTFGTNHGRSMPTLASRGCPYACTFCSSEQMWTRKWIARDPALLLNEMKGYMVKYNITNFDFYDLTAIVDRDWIITFCKLIIKEELNITWQLPSGTRSEAIDEEVVELLYASGCRNMNYAPESGSIPELKRIKKLVNLDNMVKSMKSANKIGLEVKCNFIFGMPQADWTDVIKTMKFIIRLGFIGCQDISAFPYSAYPGTEMFDQLVKEGKIHLGNDYLIGLAGFTDIGEGKSFNDNFSSKMLGIICFSAMVLFYSVSWITHPKRIFEFFSSILKKDTSSRLTYALSNVKRKSILSKTLSRESEKTATIDPSFKPKEVKQFSKIQ